MAENVKTIAELMETEERQSSRVLVKLAAGLLISVGLVFTGALNFLLYSRPFPAGYQVFGIIPALLIEGSLAVFMLGSFVWFSHGAQGTLAKVFGWAMFAIVALNTIVEFNSLAGNTAGAGGWLDLYAFWGVPVVVPLVIGFWKAVIDADPDIFIMRQNRRLEVAIKAGKHESVFNHLSTEEHRQAITAYGHRVGADIDRSLLGPEPKPRQLPPERMNAEVDVPEPEIVPVAARKNGHRPNS